MSRVDSCVDSKKLDIELEICYILDKGTIFLFVCDNFVIPKEYIVRERRFHTRFLKIWKGIEVFIIRRIEKSMNLNSNFLRPEKNSKNSCPGADLSWKLVRSFGPMSQFAGKNGGARTAHVAPYSHERFTPLESSLSLSPNTRIRSKSGSVDGRKE